MKNLLDNEMFLALYGIILILFVFIEPLVSILMAGMWVGFFLAKPTKNELKIGDDDEK